MCRLTTLLHRSVHVKCVSFKSRSTSCKTNKANLEDVDIEEEVFCQHFSGGKVVLPYWVVFCPALVVWHTEALPCRHTMER